MFSITGQKKKIQNTTEKGTKKSTHSTNWQARTHPKKCKQKHKQTNADNGADGIDNKDRAITVVYFLFSVHFCQSQYCSLDLI